MKRFPLIAALTFACATVLAPRAFAQSAQFVFTPMTPVFNPPGSTFQFSISLVVTVGGNFQNVQGLTFFLQQVGGSTFPFSIVGRDNEGDPGTVADDSLFNDEISTNAQLLSSANGNNLIDAGGNERDIGALADTPLGSGTYFITTLTLSVGPNFVPGSYTIQSITTGPRTAIVNDSDGNTFPIQPGMITITTLAVPEPSTYALLAIGLAGAGAIVYRRRRVPGTTSTSV